MASTARILIAGVCALGAVASASAQPSSFSFKAYSDLETIVDAVDLHMTMDDVGFGTLLVTDVDSQANFAGPQAAGLMIFVEFEGAVGAIAEVSLYRTPDDYSGFEPFSTFPKLDNAASGLTVHFANSTFVSVTFEGELSRVNNTEFDFFSFASTTYNNGNPVLPDGFMTEWDNAIIINGRAPELVFETPAPTAAPSPAPTFAPTDVPTKGVQILVNTEPPTAHPSSISPTTVTTEPTNEPSHAPTYIPTRSPTDSGASLATVSTLTALVVGVAQIFMLV